MAVTYAETGTAADNGANVGSSGATIASTPISREILEGGSAGGAATITLGVFGADRAACMLQTDVGVPGLTTWDGGAGALGDYVTRFNVTTANADMDWVATYIDARTTGGVFNNVASLTGQTEDLGATGVRTMTVNRGSDYTANATDTLYIVCIFNDPGPHGNSNVGITFDQNVDTPFVIPTGGASNQGWLWKHAGLLAGANIPHLSEYLEWLARQKDRRISA